MEYRTLGRTGWDVSAVSIGTWALGGSWGDVDDSESLQALRRAQVPMLTADTSHPVRPSVRYSINDG